MLVRRRAHAHRLEADVRTSSSHARTGAHRKVSCWCAGACTDAGWEQAHARAQAKHAQTHAERFHACAQARARTSSSHARTDARRTVSYLCAGAHKRRLEVGARAHRRTQKGFMLVRRCAHARRLGAVPGRARGLHKQMQTGSHAPLDANTRRRSCSLAAQTSGRFVADLCVHPPFFSQSRISWLSIKVVKALQQGLSTSSLLTFCNGKLCGRVTLCTVGLWAASLVFTYYFPVAPPFQLLESVVFPDIAK